MKWFSGLLATCLRSSGLAFSRAARRIVWSAIATLSLVGATGAEEPAGPSSGASVVTPRRPTSDTDMRRWLENMVWFHHFSDEEIALATGLKNAEITAALDRFHV